MEDDDRDHLVTLAEALVGRSLRRHTWPWLRDDDGEPIVVDAFWPDIAVALGLATEPFDPWKLTGEMLRLRGIRLVVVPPAALPWGEDGRLVRDDERLLGLLSDRELPREEWEDPGDGRPTRLGDHERPSTADLIDSDWTLRTRGGTLLSWDDDQDWPEPPEAGLADSWRGGPILSAALGAAVLGRAVVGDEVRGGLSALQLQVLAALAAAGDPDRGDRGGARQDSPVALSRALELPVEAVRGAVRSLVDAKLLTVWTDEPPTLLPTAAGRTAVDDWVRRIAPRFGGWPPRTPEADDAG